MGKARKITFTGFNVWIIAPLITCLFLFLFTPDYLYFAGNKSYAMDENKDRYDKDTNDDTPHHATPMRANDPNSSQTHNLHDPNDIDWLIFHAYHNRRYRIEIDKNGDWELNVRLMDAHENDYQMEHSSNYISQEKIYRDTYYIEPNIMIPKHGFYLLEFSYGSRMKQKNAKSNYDPNATYEYIVLEIATDGLEGFTSTILGFVRHRDYNFGIPGAQIVVEIDPNGTFEWLTYLTTLSWDEGIYYLFDIQGSESGKEYQIYATAPGYLDSTKIPIVVKENYLYSLDIYLSQDPEDPNSAPEPILDISAEIWEDAVESAYNDYFAIYIINLYTGGKLNLFSYPCPSLEFDSNCFIQNAHNVVMQYFNPVRFFMDIYGLDPNGRVRNSYMDTNLSMSVQGDIFTLDPHEGYMVYLDIQDPNKQISSLPLHINCPHADPNESPYTLKQVINLIGFLKPSLGYTSHSLLGDSNVKAKLNALFNYLPQKGRFYSNYYLFGRPCGPIFNFVKDKGYILFTKEEIVDWLPK